MEYAISIIVTLTFVILYVATKKTDRESFSKYLTENEYVSSLKILLKNFSLPNENGKKEYSVKKFIRKIKYVNFLCKLHIKQNTAINKLYISDLEFFHQIVEGNKSILKKISKTDFSKLGDMPSNNKFSRIEIMCRLILDGNKYQFSENRLATTFHFFNNSSTITFPEIQNFKLMANFILIEKLYFVATRIQNLIKVGNFAKKVVTHPQIFQNKRFFNQVKTNNIFLHFSSSLKNLECPSADLVYYDVIENINQISQSIFNGLKFVESYDFTKFYAPLNFLNNFEVFSNSPIKTKIEFLTELSRQSSSLNIDELAYSYSLIKYFKREEVQFFMSKKFQFFGKLFNITSFKSNMKTLSIALKSPIAMNLIFAPKNQKYIKT